MTSQLPGAWRSARDAARTQLWPLPTTGVVIAVSVGILVPQLDAAVDDTLPQWLQAVVFDGDGDAARTVLDAVASSLITVTALTFSLTVVTLQLASSQFSPRLLRTFTQDLFVQLTLAVFLATFTYSLTVLRSVSGGQSQQVFVPRLAVTTSYLLAVCSVIGLVLFLAHLTRQIRPEMILHRVHVDTSQAIKHNLSKRDTQSPQEPVMAVAPPGAKPLKIPESGFLLRVDHARLLKKAVETDAFLTVTALPGDFLVGDTPVGQVWSAHGFLASPDLDQTRAAFAASLHIGQERAAAHDVAFGLRQLTDVVNKALSPGINDPTTAVHALGHVSALLSELAQCQLGPLVVRDEQGQARVWVNQPHLADLLDLSMTQPRRYGASDPIVLARLMQVLAELALHVRPDDREVVARQLDRLVDAATLQGFDAASQRAVADQADQVRGALTRARSEAVKKWDVEGPPRLSAGR